MDLREMLERIRVLGENLADLFRVVIASESNTFLKRCKVRIPGPEEREKASKEVQALGGRQAVWDSIGRVMEERDRLKSDLEGYLRGTSLRAVLPNLDEDLYEQLIGTVGRVHITRLSPDPREIGGIPQVAEDEVKALVREFGGGKYRLEYYGTDEFQGKREIIEFGGNPKSDSLFDVLTRWGLRTV